MPLHSMRILIVKLSSIGDVVHTLPAVAALRRSLPTAHLAWAVERRASAILKDCPAIDERIELDTRGWRKNWHRAETHRQMREALAQLRGETGEQSCLPDLAIDFQGLLKSGVIAALSKAARRIGFETGELRESASRIFITEAVTTHTLPHVIEKNLALAHAAVVAVGGEWQAGNGYEFPITVSADDEAYITGQLEEVGEEFAILNPGGGWPTKLWPAERFGQLADWLWREFAWKSVVTYGAGEERLAQSVVSHAKSGAAQMLDATLKQLVVLARRARLFVSGDTGPLHIAAACRTPIVGIYGPTSAERNGPFDPLDVTVGRDLWCRPNCHRRRCWHWNCMEISLSHMQQAVRQRVGG